MKYLHTMVRVENIENSLELTVKVKLSSTTENDKLLRTSK